MKRSGALALAFALLAGSLGATGVEPRPEPRPVPRPELRPDLGLGSNATASRVPTQPVTVSEAIPRPQLRPVAPVAEAAFQGDPDAGMLESPAREDVTRFATAAVFPLVDLENAPRPQLRSEAFVQQVLFGRAKRRRGSVCGDIDIQGEKVGAVPGKLPGCGAKDAVRVTSVAGVQLSQSSVMTCDTAKSLRRWVERDVETAFGRGNRVVSLRVAAHYSCRTRNNRPGAKISEHGKGKAIDISGFGLEDGQMVTVLRGWQDRKTKKVLKRIWKAACGPFGTVLGPEADIYHRDHFHLDTARHRGGAYCR